MSHNMSENTYQITSLKIKSLVLVFRKTLTRKGHGCFNMIKMNLKIVYILYISTHTSQTQNTCFTKSHLVQLLCSRCLPLLLIHFVILTGPAKLCCTCICSAIQAGLVPTLPTSATAKYYTYLICNTA